MYFFNVGNLSVLQNKIILKKAPWRRQYQLEISYSADNWTCFAKKTRDSASWILVEILRNGNHFFFYVEGSCSGTTKYKFV